MNTEKFNQLYKQLNREQKEAVDWIEGPVMVVAGPGTGKTQILALRIANILRKTDTHPANILAITFTDSGAISMRRRLAEIIGSPAYSVVINTFHGFCNDVIKNYPEEFPHIIGSQSITEIDQIKLLEDIIISTNLDKLKPFGDPLHYLKPILSGVNTLKREGVDSDAFQIITEKELDNFNSQPDLYHEKGAHKGKMKGPHQNYLKRIEKNRELSLVYKKYQKELTKAKFYDYSDMIMEAMKALLKNKNLLMMLQEQHQYILVDEHQDTNNAQNKVLELLCNFHKNPNIFVVGDEKQAIFRFQGASIENFNYFKKLYKKTKLIILKENYRSTQAILDSAHSLIESAGKLHSNVKHKNNYIRLATLSSPEVEYFFLAKDIMSKLSKFRVPQEIAVLYRDNIDAFPIAKILEKFSVPFFIESDQNILADEDIKKLILIFKAVHKFGSDEVFVEAMHIDFLKILPLDIYKIASYASQHKISVYDIVKSPDKMKGMDIESCEQINNFYKKLSSFASFNKNRGLADFFENTMRESGFLSHILGSDEAVEKMDKINGLFDEVRTVIEKHKDSKLENLMEYLSMLDQHNILIKKRVGGHGGGRVRLMTAHKSKGLEFDYVYITGAFDGHWGNKRRAGSLMLLPGVYAAKSGKILEDSDSVDDERRLFYVALTRARKEVVISYSKTGDDKKERLPSQFITELKPELIIGLDVKKYEESFSKHKEILYAAPASKNAGILDKRFVRELFLHHGLSVTAINNYLECPWKYFYTNLLRIPRAPSKHQMFGTAIHGALKDFFKIKKDRGEASKKILLDKFRHYLTSQPLSSSDFNDSLKKGLASLSGYFEEYKNTWNTNTLNEFKISGIILGVDIRITGIIDKLEIIDATNGVNVVDYKTGKPKSRAEIEGTTKNSAGNIKRQLAFYNLLLDKYENGRWRMISGEIDFVEPDTKGRYKKEKFIIEKGEIEEMEDLIKKISGEILELKFWDKTCGDSNCEFCNLRKMMN